MTHRTFLVNNRKHKFEAKLWKEERAVCFQILKQENIKGTYNVRSFGYPGLSDQLIYLRGCKSKNDFLPDCKLFLTNEERDQYYETACEWLRTLCDKNSVAKRKFDIYDVHYQANSNAYIYRTKHGNIHRVFVYDIDNFAGIKYEGSDAFFMSRKILVNGYLVDFTPSILIDESDISQAIPEKIRFFKSEKGD